MNPSSSHPFAVITGASSGIGFELAKQFAQHDFDLLIVAEDSGITTAASTLGELGTQVQAEQIDLAKYDGVETFYKAIVASGRPVDAIAINAGVGVSGRFADQIDLQAELNLINLNVTSSVHLAKRVLPGMLERDQGRILFTSSIAATAAGPFEAVYAASKAFLLSFSEALRPMSPVKDSRPSWLERVTSWPGPS
jgi:short-subunit dehydrogenase